ncbi:MAG: DcrB-related protein [Clostridia bacterium]|nr:DcrB-related protein [Clostridia bacterium]
MKKTVFLVITLVLALSLLCGCTSSSYAPDGMKLLESSDKLDYNIYIPAGWVQDLSTGAVSAYVSSNDLSNVSMTQFNLEELKKLDEYVSDYITELEENLQNFKLKEGYPENGKTILNGVEAAKIEYTAKLVGNEYKFMQIICVKGGTIYYFTYTALAEAYDSHLEAVEQILDNFSFKK